MVQWPELWTRGAISLTTRPPTSSSLYAYMTWSMFLEKMPACKPYTLSSTMRTASSSSPADACCVKTRAAATPAAMPTPLITFLMRIAPFFLFVCLCL